MFASILSVVFARSIAAGLCALIFLTGCTSGTASPAETSQLGDANDGATTTTAPPIVLATAENLGLPIGQCWNELAVASTTVPVSAPTLATDPTTTTQPTTTQTTLPKPDTVAIVDCSGTNQGEVYSSYCIGVNPELTTEVESASGAATSDVLERVPCPGQSDLTWPGDRELRRAAARICLDVFSIVFQETYAVSDRTAQEMTPNEGLWDRGERRVVCSASQPAATTTSAPSP